jgi:REP element-mobilizing transposase RayT
MNRGIARRVVFPDRAHIRHFLALLALAVRRGEIEVHAFCVMATHFHLLVRSTRGRLSEALRRVQNEYVRFYNRRHTGRDGSLFRGRFHSRPVLSIAYHDLLVRYIEHNPVRAGLVARAEEYPYCSAAIRSRGRQPLWLAAWWVEDVLDRVRRVDPSATYASLWGGGLSPAEAALVEARTVRPSPLADNLDDLVNAAPAHVRRWMEAQARQADGQGARPLLVDADTVSRVIAQGRAAGSTWSAHGRRGPPFDLWPCSHASLLRSLAGQTHVEIAERLGVTAARAAQLLSRHRIQMKDGAYAQRVAELGAACLRAVHATRPDALRQAPRERWKPLSRRV